MVESIAASRGVPANHSTQVKLDLERIAADEAKYGPGVWGGYTHASWAELKSFTLEPTAFDFPDWKMLFDLVRQLEQRHDPENIQFILWFNW